MYELEQQRVQSRSYSLEFESFLEKYIRQPRVIIGLASTGIAMILFWLITYIASLLHGDYNHVSQAISQLELGSGSYLAKSAMMMAGVLIICFSLGLFSYFRPPKHLTFLFGTVLLVIGGISTIIIAFVPPARVAEDGFLHTFLASTIMGSLPIALILLLFQFWKAGWRKVFVFTLLSMILGASLSIWSVFSPEEWFGLIERMILANGMFWYGTIGTYIIYNVTRGNLRHVDKLA